MTRWLARLHHLDRRWLYLATAVLLLASFGVRIPAPPGRVSVATKGLYDAIESCPPDKVVFIDSSWDQGSQAENYAQLECVVQHLCRKGAKFVVASVGVTPFGTTFADKVIQPIAEGAGYAYGRDWVNLGFVQAPDIRVVINGLCRDLHAVWPQDARGKAVGELPLMARVHTIRDVHLVYSITYQPTTDWIGLVHGQYGTPVAFGCMSIMSPYYSTYLDSGQLRGMLVGNRGAAEYESLLRLPGVGSQRITFASFGNCMVLLAIVLGNLGLWAMRRHSAGSCRPEPVEGRERRAPR